MEDITATLQQMVSEACKKNLDKTQLVSMLIPKGDYYLQLLTIPKNGHILLSSKDRARLLFSGKRNRPMFVLEDNSVLVLKEKLEIYYNTNNIQEVAKLMVRYPQSSRVEISQEVKVSLFSMKQPE